MPNYQSPKLRLVGHAKYVREGMRPSPCISYTTPEAIAAKLAGQEAVGEVVKPTSIETQEKFQRMTAPKVQVDHRVITAQKQAARFTPTPKREEAVSIDQSTYADAINKAMREEMV